MSEIYEENSLMDIALKNLSQQLQISIRFHKKTTINIETPKDLLERLIMFRALARLRSQDRRLIMASFDIHDEISNDSLYNALWEIQ